MDFGLSKRLSPELRAELRAGIFALLQSRLDDFLAGMRRLDTIAPGAEPGVRRAVEAMFERLRSEAGGPLGMGAERVLALKDEAKRLLEETPGLQLPNDLLLYAKTLSYLFALGRELLARPRAPRTVTPHRAQSHRMAHGLKQRPHSQATRAVTRVAFCHAAPKRRGDLERSSVGGRTSPVCGSGGPCNQ